MGTLTRKLNAVEGQQVAVGIDPMIIASIRILGNTAPQSAIDWLERLDGIGNETFALSYADSDLAALSQAGSGAVLAPTSFVIDPSLYPVEQEAPGLADRRPRREAEVDEAARHQRGDGPQVDLRSACVVCRSCEHA